MANCKRCGAYIPDGRTACLACGYDEKAEAAPKNTGAAAAQQAKKTENDTTYHFKNNDEIFRQQFEENRRRQQEQSRKWAEQEAQRRRMAEQNTARNRAAVYPQRSTAGDMSSEKLWSILSYASILCLVPYLTGKGGETARFHSGQGIRLLVFSAVADALGGIPIIGWLLLAARIYLMIKGIMNALNGRREPLPYIGTIGPR